MIGGVGHHPRDTKVDELVKGFERVEDEVECAVKDDTGGRRANVPTFGWPSRYATDGTRCRQFNKGAFALPAAGPRLDSQTQRRGGAGVEVGLISQIGCRDGMRAET